MIKVYIEKESFNQDEEFITFSGQYSNENFYIGPAESDDYDDNTREFLYEFLRGQSIFPVYIVFEPYSDVAERTISTLEKAHIQHTCIQNKVNSKKQTILKVVVKDDKKLKFLLEEFFWFAASNQFFSVSFSDNCSYHLVTRKGFIGKNRAYMIPNFHMHSNSTVITIFHDGFGVNIYSNDSKFSSIDNLAKSFPPNVEIDSN